MNKANIILMRDNYLFMSLSPSLQGGVRGRSLPFVSFVCFVVDASCPFSTTKFTKITKTGPGEDHGVIEEGRSLPLTKGMATSSSEDLSWLPASRRRSQRIKLPPSIVELRLDNRPGGGSIGPRLQPSRVVHSLR